MQPPDELMVEVFLPAMRQLVSRVLKNQGLSQSAISRLLGTTQASVSIYLSSPADRAYRSLESLHLDREKAELYSELLSEDLKRGPLFAQETIESVWTGLLARGMACDVHRSRYPFLADCDVCMKQFHRARGQDQDAIEEVQRAVKTLESSKSFASVMPQVSVNLAYAPKDSQSPDDVVAVPGRIVKVKDRAVAMSTPEFGASGHLAKLLIIVRKGRPEFRACINLRFDSKMVTALRRMKLEAITIGGGPVSWSADPTLDSLNAKMRSNETRGSEELDVVYGCGAPPPPAT